MSGTDSRRSLPPPYEAIRFTAMSDTPDTMPSLLDEGATAEWLLDQFQGLCDELIAHIADLEAQLAQRECSCGSPEPQEAPRTPVLVI